MSKRVILFSAAFVALLTAMPLAARIKDGQWHVPVPVSTAGSATKPDVTIAATLTEFRIALDPAHPTIRAGQHVLFVIENKGELDHEFMISSAAMAGMGGMTMAQMDAMAVAVVEPDQLPPGATVKLSVVFNEPGTYEIACHLPGHEAMKTTIVVSG